MTATATVPGRLVGRVALVTGAARGLGAGIACALAARGAVVACADLRDTAATVASLPAPDGQEGLALTLDVTDARAVEQAVAELVARHGTLDILVANAGVVQPIVDTVDTDDAVFERLFGVNVQGVFHCARAAGRVMRDQGRGRIVVTASARGRIAWPGLGVYSATKAAVLSLTQSLALELGPHGVTVNAICPGTMWTDMAESAFTAMAEQQGSTVEALLKEHVKGIPVGRLGNPEDAGAAVAYLASDEAAFVNGEQLNLTGGEDLY